MSGGGADEAHQRADGGAGDHAEAEEGTCAGRHGSVRRTVGVVPGLGHPSCLMLSISSFMLKLKNFSFLTYLKWYFFNFIFFEIFREKFKKVS